MNSLALFSTYGWVLAIVAWMITIYYWIRPSVSIQEVAKELFWVVEQIDELSKGAIKGPEKWVIFRNLLLLIARILGRITTKCPEAKIEELGKSVVDTLIAEKYKNQTEESESDNEV